LAISGEGQTQNDESFSWRDLQLDYRAIPLEARQSDRPASVFAPIVGVMINTAEAVPQVGGQHTL
jgi:hypothetical protein